SAPHGQRRDAAEGEYARPHHPGRGPDRVRVLLLYARARGYPADRHPRGCRADPPGRYDRGADRGHRQHAGSGARRRPAGLRHVMPAAALEILRALEKKVLWLASWTIHHANHLRENVDGLKVGGHQASSASLATVMTALYFDVLRPQDRVAVKPHASPN